MAVRPGFSDTSDAFLDRQDQILQRAEALEPLPRSVSMLTQAVASGQSSAADLTAIIEQDLVLVGRLLQVANSAWSGPADTIGTTEGAVVRLGTELVLSLSVGFAVKVQLGRALRHYSLDADQLWRHSFMCSVAADLVREHAGETVPLEVSTAALLHDVGKIVLHGFMDEHRAARMAALRTNGLRLIDAEMEALEVHHGEVGAAVCRTWNMPDSIVVAVQYHHHPAQPDSNLAHAVFLADEITHRIEAEQHPGTPPATSMDLVASMETLGVDGAMFPALVVETITRYQDRASLHDKI